MVDFMRTVADAAASVQDRRFLEDAIHRKARQDFKEMVQSKTGYMAIDNMNFQRVKMLSLSAEKDIGYFLPIGHDMKQRKVELPVELLDITDENKYVAVVGYVEGRVTGYYVFNATNFKKPDKGTAPELPPYQRFIWFHKFIRWLKTLWSSFCALPSKMSMYGYNKEKDRFVIKLPGGVKLRQYSFGNALKSIQK